MTDERVTYLTSSDQKIFDYVVRKLVEQGGPALDLATNHCVYRAKSGRKCAFGHLIPDEEFRPDMEGNRSYWVLEQLGATNLLADRTKSIISYLQHIHDSVYNRVSSFEGEATWNLPELCRAFEVMAKEYNLSTAVVDEVFKKVPTNV